MLLLGTVYVFVILDLQHPLIVKIALVLAAAGIGYKVPWLYVKNRITKRQIVIRRSWPDALDLLLICVECGMAIEGALRKVSEEIGVQCPELAEELSLTTAELSYLQDRRKAYENLAERTDLDAVKSVVTSLIQSEKYGTPLGQSLRVLAQESRDMRMSEAEKRAAALPPKLTVPMILFFLPVLFAVIITPAALQVMNLK
jgi:tight adherence protein C